MIPKNTSHGIFSPTVPSQLVRTDGLGLHLSERSAERGRKTTVPPLFFSFLTLSTKRYDNLRDSQEELQLHYSRCSQTQVYETSRPILGVPDRRIQSSQSYSFIIHAPIPSPPPPFPPLPPANPPSSTSPPLSPTSPTYSPTSPPRDIQPPLTPLSGPGHPPSNNPTTPKERTVHAQAHKPTLTTGKRRDGQKRPKKVYLPKQARPPAPNAISQPVTTTTSQ